MDIIGLITNLVGGAAGGNATGTALKDKSLGVIGNTIAGAVGGVAGGYIIQFVGVLNSMGLADKTLSGLGTELGAGAVGGGVLAAVVGFIKKAVEKK